MLTELALVDAGSASPDARQPILGYYTLSATSVALSGLPQDVASKLPRHGKIPAILIGRLAVHERLQKPVGPGGYGRRVLVEALLRCLALSDELGAWAIVVDALNERAASFYQRFGFRFMVESEEPSETPTMWPRQLYLRLVDVAAVLNASPTGSR